ncbi:hypothetical protein LCGC14_1156020 [marine sediment metagenome]|uniref:Uncharacterized protein n=1 Tax=marine sediment metagenome TaxID=412755 RepID=A0A0F9LTZ9_9ZZZZ
MQIKTVKVIHGEARIAKNTGEFVQYTVGYEADVSADDDAQECHKQLMERAIRAVRLLHGDAIFGVELTITADIAPF